MLCLFLFPTDKSQSAALKEENVHREKPSPSSSPPKTFSEEYVVLKQDMPKLAASPTFRKELPTPSPASAPTSSEYDVIFNQDILFKKQAPADTVPVQGIAGVPKQVRIDPTQFEFKKAPSRCMKTFL